jgi:hypothetical protein
MVMAKYVREITNGDAIRLRAKLKILRLSIDDTERALNSEYMALTDLQENFEMIIERVESCKNSVKKLNFIEPIMHIQH